MFGGLRRKVSRLFHSPRRLLFDHVPKCAGTTVSAYLSSQYPARLSFQMDGDQPARSVAQFRAMSEAQRQRYQLIAGHDAHKLLDHVDPSTLTLTILRDPVDRIVSHYFFVKRTAGHYLRDRLIRDDIQLEDYAASDLSPELSNWYTTHYSGFTIEEACADPVGALERAYATVIERYDIIGFQNELPQTMDLVRDAAGLFDSFENIFLNKTVGRERLEDVSDLAKRRIAEANSLDVELYERLSNLCHRGSTVRLVRGGRTASPVLSS